MYFYHLKFELYVPSTVDQAIKLYDSVSSSSKKEFPENNNSPDLYFVPKDIFEKLPSHQFNSDTNNLFLQRTNSFNKSKPKTKARSKSVDLSKNLTPGEIPLIPPTPVSSSSSSVTSSNWNKVVRRKSFASTSSSTLLQPAEDSTLNFDKTHDFRFGNIEIEWFDNLEANMNEEQQVQTNGTCLNVVNNIQNGNGNETNLSSESYPETSISENSLTKKSKSGREKAINPPAGEFVPLKSGKTNLSYGILHLYRDPKEIPFPKEDHTINNVNIRNDNLKSSEHKESNSLRTVENEKVDNFPDLIGDNETILAVLAVPSYMTASDFLGFVAPVRKYVSHFRFIRYILQYASVFLFLF
jgi:BRCA1-associated protein